MEESIQICWSTCISGLVQGREGDLPLVGVGKNKMRECAVMNVRGLMGSETVWPKEEHGERSWAVVTRVTVWVLTLNS